MVEPDRVVDALFGEAVAAHRDTVAVRDRAAELALDAELITQLVNGRAGLVALDQLPHLVVREFVGCGRARRVLLTT